MGRAGTGGGNEQWQRAVNTGGNTTRVGNTARPKRGNTGCNTARLQRRLQRAAAKSGGNRRRGPAARSSGKSQRLADSNRECENSTLQAG
ncbi:Hypothetical protein FKW44_003337 [Caligus rogercresseyi]|uniref:Uncharacterized protein n=1 Tax=Caligus rogercresseyi TaxID=217165 RepID=A0A7T8KLH6_CALRO|nr:Hypothetical protein FKW44_003337 [Caligus rogercresseyi]